MTLKKTELPDMKIIKWLVNRDPAITWQVMKDLPGESDKFFELANQADGILLKRQMVK
jgi:hypothetical protein